MADFTDDLNEMMTAALKLAQTNGSLIAALTMTKHLIEAIGEVGQVEPKLAPELVAAVEKAKEISDILGRAHHVAVTDFDVTIQKLGRSTDAEG